MLPSRSWLGGAVAGTVAVASRATLPAPSDALPDDPDRCAAWPEPPGPAAWDEEPSRPASSQKPRPATRTSTSAPTAQGSQGRAPDPSPGARWECSPGVGVVGAPCTGVGAGVGAGVGTGAAAGAAAGGASTWSANRGNRGPSPGT